jgi:hypothetical protein
MGNNVQTLVIDNFRGSFTELLDGDINSGLANIISSSGYNSFHKPGNLTWSEDPVQIDPNASVITDLIMAGKPRVESGITYVYTIGHTGRLYKIQVNDPTTFNPDYDNPVLLATLSINTPTFTRGGFIDFYGATEKIYIGHDKGVTSINFDGSGEAFVGALGSWTQNVPRPLKQFTGVLYVGNGENIAAIDTTATVTTYAKINPAFPKGTQLRDMDISIDGNYMQFVVSSLAQADITTTTQDTSIISNLGSFIYYWNGIEQAVTATTSFPLTNLTANIIFGNSQYVFGYDIRGPNFFTPVSRISASAGDSNFGEVAFPNAIMSDGEMLAFGTNLYFEGALEFLYSVYGTYDSYIGTGYWSPMSMRPTSPETDIVHVPYLQSVTNFLQGISSNGYTSNIYGTSTVYFSTMETSSAPTTKYRLYKWSATNNGLNRASSYNYYQTQAQIFSKKIIVKEVRVYGDPWVANNEFSVDLLGSGDNVLHTETMTAGSNLTIGDDFYWFNPVTKPTYKLSVGIMNIGTANNVIDKIEIDYATAGK